MQRHVERRSESYLRYNSHIAQSDFILQKRVKIFSRISQMIKGLTLKMLEST